MLACITVLILMCAAGGNMHPTSKKAWHGIRITTLRSMLFVGAAGCESRPSPSVRGAYSFEGIIYYYLFLMH